MQVFFRTGLALALGLLLAQSLAGCENWPLYLQLEPEQPPDRAAVLIELLEDVTLDDGEIQEYAPLPYPAIVRIRGGIDSCGFDSESDEYEWPEHQVGEAAEIDVIRGRGWYTGDVDYYSLRLNEAGWVEIQLEWDRLPSGESNAPFLPDDQDAAWTSESDLDFLVVASSSAVEGTILNDDGFSLSYPETVSQSIAVEPGVPLVVAVACHHQLPTSYELLFDFNSP